MKLLIRISIIYHYRLALLLCLLVANTCFGSEKSKPPLTYKQFQEYNVILKYLPKESHGKVRLPTEDEMKYLKSFIPTIPVKKNAAYYYVRAASYLNSENPPPGSRESMVSEFDGNVRNFDRWLKQNSKALREFKKGVKQEKCQFPPLVLVDGGRLIVDYLEYSKAGGRRLARICVDAGFFNEIQGKNDVAAEWYLSCLKMAVHFRKDSTVMGTLVGNAIAQNGYRPLGELLIKNALSKRTLKLIVSECHLAEVETEERINTFIKESESAFWMFGKEGSHEKIRKFGEEWEKSTEYENEIIFEAKETVWDLAQLSDQKYMEFVDKIPIAYKTLQRIASKPLWELTVPDFDLKELIPEGLQTDELMIWVFNTWKPWFRCLAELDLNIKTIEVVAAIVLRTEVTGNYSTDYSDLVPKWLPEIPIDPFTGRPLDFHSDDDEEDKISNNIIE